MSCRVPGLRVQIHPLAEILQQREQGGRSRRVDLQPHARTHGSPGTHGRGPTLSGQGPNTQDSPRAQGRTGLSFNPPGVVVPGSSTPRAPYSVLHRGRRAIPLLPTAPPRGPLRGEVPTGPGTPLRSEWRPASPGLPCPGHQLPAPRGCRDANAGLGTGPCWSSPQYRLGHCFLEAPLPPAGAFLGVSLSSFTFFSRAFPLLGAEKVRETLLNSRGKTPTSPSKRFLDTCR